MRHEDVPLAQRMGSLIIMMALAKLNVQMGAAARQRGDSNPCGQSPMDFESISLAARTHCLLAMSSRALLKQQLFVFKLLEHASLASDLDMAQAVQGSLSSVVRAMVL